MKLLPKTLVGQLLALLSLALVASLAVSLFLFVDERAVAVREADRLGLLDQIAGVGRMLDLLPADQRARLAQSAGSPHIRFWTTAESALPAPADSDGRVLLAHQFEHMFPDHLREPPRLAFVGLDRPPPPPSDRAGDDHLERHREPQFDVIASLPFHDSGWLNAETRIHAEPIPLPLPSLLSAALMGLASFAIVVLVARRVTRPLQSLADSADAFGRGAPAPHLNEAGPDEARRLIAAFNRMQERLSRFVADRTRMLAAIGHDLRTPITSLKLRAELLDDDEAKAKMLTTLDEMEYMTEATLAFAREDATSEASRTIDLAAAIASQVDDLAELLDDDEAKAKMLTTLEEMEHMTEATLAFAREDATSEASRTIDLAAAIASQVDDLAELGKPVSFSEAPRLAYSCRPTALKRAIGNLIENAVQYGERARVSLSDTPMGPVITVDDDGPGIPEERLEEVFKPFVRLETSRSRATGGAGLGLAIARSIVLSHGGELKLSNRSEGGLRAEIRLPA